MGEPGPSSGASRASEESSPAGSPATAGSRPPGSSVAAIRAAERRRKAEIWIVLGLSLGQSAAYSVISLAAKLTAGKPLAQQRATLNASQSPRPYVDLSYQIADVVFTLVPVALALWLLSEGGRSALRRLGLDRRHPLQDVGVGLVLAALIGLPGLGLYELGRAAGITADVVPSGLSPHWWTVPILILQAVKNAMLEEVIAVGYLVSRLEELRWPAWAIVLASATLRGSYHLYQGFGPFIGNALMGAIFAEWFRRRRRLVPLIIAHTTLDVVAFVGYQLVGRALGM